jgi:hypothetical protein
MLDHLDLCAELLSDLRALEKEALEKHGLVMVQHQIDLHVKAARQTGPAAPGGRALPAQAHTCYVVRFKLQVPNLQVQSLCKGDAEELLKTAMASEARADGGAALHCTALRLHCTAAKCLDQ